MPHKPRHGFARSVVTLAGGTMTSQALMVAVSPLLTRLYAPEAFGTFTVFVSLLTILSCIATLRYEMAVPLPEKDCDAFLICMASIGITVIYAVCLAVPAIALDEPISLILGTPILAKYLWLLPLGVLGIGVYQSLYYWAVRQERYRSLAVTRITQSLVMVGIQIGGYAAGVVALLAGHVASRYTGIYALMRALPAASEWRPWISRKGTVQQLSKYRNFALWSAPGALLNNVGAQMPMLAFASLYSPHSAGLYALTHRVLSLPITVAGTAVADVFFSDAPSAHRKGILGDVVATLLYRLMLFGAPAMAAIMLTGPIFFSLAFGSEWAEAGLLANLAAPWLLLTFITSPLSRTFLVVQRQRELFLLQLLQPCVGLLAICVSVFLDMDFREAFLTFSVTYALFYFVYLSRCLSASGASYSRIAREAIEIATITAIVVPLPYLLIEKIISANNIWADVTKIAICAALTLACYMVLLLRARTRPRYIPLD